MTLQQLKNRILGIVEAGGIETPAFDAMCLLEDIGGIGRGNVAACAGNEVLPERCDAVIKAAKRRAEGEPLQYLLGTWDFLSLTLEVGDGVLIPRPETELLCQVAAECLQGLPCKDVLDLCSGSGCVGLGIASLCPSATVTAVELSDDALPYLKRNIARYPAYSVKAVHGNVLTDADRFETVDAIVSNPPYIPTDDLNTLQREVQHEPRMALDGDKDGYRFYRAIAKQWVPKIRSGGFAAVEVGIGQAKSVAALFEQHGLTDITIHTDFGGIERVVVGWKSK